VVEQLTQRDPGHEGCSPIYADSKLSPFQNSG
jgi:hypothetical protein